MNKKIKKLEHTYISFSDHYKNKYRYIWTYDTNTKEMIGEHIHVQLTDYKVKEPVINQYKYE
jgi:hypothetical protein